MIPVVWIGAFLLFGTAEANEVCYQDLGCFSDKPPWSGIPGRNLFGLPASPESMNISLLLFTRETGNLSQKLLYDDRSTIQNSHFSPSRKTHFIIHGYTSTGKYGWVVDMCLLLIKVENTNCIAVDWEDGAKCTYFRAGSNIRVLGAVIAYFINTLKKMYRYYPTKIHIIGHSLGAHAAGEAGRRLRGVSRQLRGLGRITGLDPPGLGFEDFPDLVRLDPSDAHFVDVIHTDAGTLGFGMFNATGDLDFYPNGGKDMPGCDAKNASLVGTDFVEFDKSIGNCHHSRSHEYYRNSILFPGGFVGYPCESYESFKKGDCFPCPKEGCPLMGYFADRFRNKLRMNNPKYFLDTGPKEPFTSWLYNISVKLSGMTGVKGEMDIAFQTKDGKTKEYQIGSGSLNQGQTYSRLISVEINPEKASRIEFIWHKKFFTLLWAKLGVERMRLVRGQDGHESFFCGSGTATYGVPQILKPC